MGKLTFLLPGQGSQKVGMGADVLAERPEALEGYLEQAEAASGLPIRRLCLEGPIDELTATEVAQPALFCVALAMADIARAAGVEPDFAAGHSLGEYTAAVVAGALAPEDGIRLVCERGRLMGEAQTKQPGAMAAVIGLDAARVAELCESVDGEVVPANLNTPSQIIVSGDFDAVDALIEAALAAGAEKSMRLKVGAAFHSPAMVPVREQMAASMEGVTFSDASVPLVSNASGELVTSAGDVREALLAQISSPVRWVDGVNTLAGAGATSFLELGPGRVLTGLVRQILDAPEVFAADSPKKLNRFVAQQAEA
jgi:[acyl-carrier-protein] S-malonyltransferase